jgi:curved DNA-binding protein
MTWYGVLGVQDYAPPEVIQAAYKAMARIHHPDTGGDTKRMAEINTAYETLSDPKKRREYDRLLGLAR